MNKGTMRVVKNTLSRRATEGVDGIRELEPLFKKQIAVVFADEAPVIAKVLYETAKKGKILVLKGGTLDAKLISREQIEYLASLPTREVLLAKLCSTLNAPLVNYIRLFNQLIVRFLTALKQIEKTKH